MLRIVGISLFFTIFQVAIAQIPHHCRGPPPGVEKPGDCCKLPALFSDEDLKECNLDEPSLKKFKGPPGDCSKHICILKKYKLMKDDEHVDKEAASEFMDKWVETNTEYKDAIDKVKNRCLSDDLPGPPQICEPQKIGMCSLVTMFEECPNWEDSDNCKKLKDHINECKAYFPF